MIKLLEVIFRRFIPILLILLVPIIIGFGMAYILAPTYQASATLWALQPYQVISSTAATSGTSSAPADTQSAGLMELLQSRAFDIAVGDSTNLKTTLNAPDTQALDNAYVTDISKNVLVTAKGNDLYQITYSNNNPQIAAQVVGAVITQFQTQGQQFSIVQGQTYSLIEAQHLLAGDQSQLTPTQNDADTAAKNESAYLTAHTASAADPQYAVLDAQRQQAQLTLTTLQSTIATLKQQIAVTESTHFFKTLDPPVAPETSQRSKLLLTTAGIGTAVGLILCIVYILVTVRRDRALYSVPNLARVTSYPILMQVPRIPKSGKEFVISGAK